MCGCGCLVSVRRGVVGRCDRSSVTVLVVDWLIAHRRSISRIACPHISRSGMRRKSIGILFSSREPGISSTLALPELPLWRPSSVPVVGRGAEGTLLAVVADESDFDGDGKEEEDTSLFISTLILPSKRRNVQLTEQQSQQQSMQSQACMLCAERAGQ